MANLDIQEVSQTQTQMPVIVFSPVTLPEGSTYNLMADHGDGFRVANFTHLRTVTENGAEYLAGRADTRLANGRVFDLSIVIRDEEGNVTDQGAVFSYAPALVSDDAKLIQQAVYDVIIAEPIFDSFGRDVAVLDDGLFQPEDLGDAGEIATVKTPFIEIKRPAHTGATTFGHAAMIHTYSMDIDISDTETVGASNDVTHLYTVAKQVIRIIRKGVGLEGAGIFNKAFSYELTGTGDITQGDNLNTVTVTVMVSQVQSM